MDALSDTPGAPPVQPVRPSRWRRFSRILLLALVGVLVLVGLAGGTAFWALAHLEHPWVKPSVVRNLREALGLSIDYRSLSVSLGAGRVHGTGLTIAQPPRFAASAAPFVRIREGQVDLDLWALLSGEVRIARADVEGLEATYVADENTDSLTLLFPTDPAEPVVPLSGSLSLLRDLGMDVARIEAPDAALTYVELEGGRPVRRARLDSLSLHGHFHERNGALDLRLDLSPSARPGTAGLRISQNARAASADGRVEARESIDATARLQACGTLLVRQAADLSLGVRVVQSSGLPLASEPPFDAALDLGIAFDPRRGRTRFDLRRFAVYGDVLTARLEGVVEDASTDTLREANGRVDLAFADAPFLPEGIDAHGVQAHLVLDHARLSPSGVAGGVNLQATAERASATMEGQRAGGEGLSLSLETLADVPLASSAAPTGAGGTSTEASEDSSFTHLRLALSARSVSAADVLSASTLEGHDLAATLTGPGLILAPQGARGLPASSGTPPENDVLDVRFAALELEQGRATSARLAAPMLHAQGIGLVGAIASNAPADGRVAFEAARVEARSGADRVDFAPVDVEMDLHAFLLRAAGLFDLGGRADIHVATSGTLRSGGDVTRLRGFSPVIDADFDRRHITLGGRVAHLASGENAMSLPAMNFALDARGDTYSIAGRATVSNLETASGRFDGTRQLELEGQADLRAQVADLDAHLRPADPNDEGPSFDASLHANIDPTTGALDHRLELETQRLAPALAPYLPEGADVAFTGLRIEGSGNWSNLFTRRPRRGEVPELARDFFTSMQGEERLELVVDGLEADRNQQHVSSPRVALTMQVSQRDGGALAELGANADTMVVRDGADEIVLEGFRPRFDVRMPDASRLDVASVAANVTIARIRQEFLPGYPVSDVRISADVDSAPGEITLREFTLTNAGGHGTLRMTGAYEHDVDQTALDDASDTEAAIDGREAFSITGELSQELGPLAGTSFARRASGRFRVGFEVQSGDLQSFQGIARLVAEGVDFTNEDGSLVIERLNGELPIVETVTLLESGPALDPGAGINALSRARFPDVQPFLNTDAYVTSQRIEWMGQSLGPMAGNVRVEGTTLSVDRLQIGYRGGMLAGQLEADLMPGASHLSFRGNATGIHTASGGEDVLDANMAIRFVPESLSLDGSMQLVRVSRSHILELLDALDPYHEDDDFNTMRTLLRVGYPRFARLRASEGLLDFEVDLGGLASAVRIEPIRAIPIAPLLEEYAFPIVDALFPYARDHVAPATPTPSNEPPRENDHD